MNLDNINLQAHRNRTCGEFACSGVNLFLTEPRLGVVCTLDWLTTLNLLTGIFTLQLYRVRRLGFLGQGSQEWLGRSIGDVRGGSSGTLFFLFD